jgi:hypothetical protein
MIKRKYTKLRIPSFIFVDFAIKYIIREIVKPKIGNNSNNKYFIHLYNMHFNTK